MTLKLSGDSDDLASAAFARERRDGEGGRTGEGREGTKEGSRQEDEVEGLHA